MPIASVNPLLGPESSLAADSVSSDGTLTAEALEPWLDNDFLLKTDFPETLPMLLLDFMLWPLLPLIDDDPLEPLLPLMDDDPLDPLLMLTLSPSISSNRRIATWLIRGLLEKVRGRGQDVGRVRSVLVGPIVVARLIRLGIHDFIVPVRGDRARILLHLFQSGH